MARPERYYALTDHQPQITAFALSLEVGRCKTGGLIIQKHCNRPPSYGSPCRIVAIFELCSWFLQWRLSHANQQQKRITAPSTEDRRNYGVTDETKKLPTTNRAIHVLAQISMLGSSPPVMITSPGRRILPLCWRNM